MYFDSEKYVELITALSVTQTIVKYWAERGKDTYLTTLLRGNVQYGDLEPAILDAVRNFDKSLLDLNTTIWSIFDVSQRELAIVLAKRIIRTFEEYYNLPITEG